MATRSGEPLAPLLRRPEVAALARAAGSTPAHLVGGCLRDRLLGLPGRDLDAVVAGRGREIARAASEALGARLVELGGDRFAAFRIVAGDVVLDLWDRRRDSLRADLERRDLTINSFAVGLRGGRVSDPFAGRADLEGRRLRATSTASFSADPLRVLRLARFATLLPGFSIEPSTLELARREAGGLGSVAAERVREELRLLLADPAGDGGAGALAALDLYPALGLGAPERRQTREVAATLARLEARCRHLERGDAEIGVDRLAARLAALCAALARPPERPAEELLAVLGSRGYVAANAERRARRLLAVPPPGSDAERRWFLHSAGAAWPTAAAFLGHAASAPGEVADWKRTAAELRRLAADPAIFAPRPLVDGNEIQDLLGVAPGPLLGHLSRLLRRAQVEGRVSSRRRALELLRAELRSRRRAR